MILTAESQRTRRLRREEFQISFYLNCRLLDKHDIKGYTSFQMRLLASFRIIRVTLAFAVALWMAGAGCLLGCENNVASATTGGDHHAKPSALVASGEVCAAHGASAKRAANSNTAKHNVKSFNSNSAATPANATDSFGNTQALAVAGGSSSMMNCPLAVNATAALSKSGPDNVDGSFAVAKASELPADSLEQVIPFARPPRLPNRGHTYLRCCVFLI